MKRDPLGRDCCTDVLYNMGHVLKKIIIIIERKRERKREKENLNEFSISKMKVS